MSYKKIQYLVARLSPFEQQRFLRFMDSPYFNTDAKLYRLAQLFIEGVNSRKDLDIALFPGTDFSYSRISNLVSYVYKHLEKFLAIERMVADPFSLVHQQFALAKARNWGDYFEHIDRAYNRHHEYEANLLPIDFLRQYQIEQERDEFFGAQQKRTADQSLSRKLEALELFHISAMLKNVCKWINRQNIIHSEPGESYDHFVRYVQAHIDRYQNQPFIRIYVQILMTLTEWENEKHYQRLLAALQEVGEMIPEAERKPMYQYAQNYCARQINSGNTSYLEELFRLYQAMIHQHLIYHEGYMAAADVKNIVSLGTRLGEYAWTDQFLDQQSEHFPPAQRAGILAFNRAQLAYAKGELRRALRLLRDAEFKDVYYDLGAKTLLLKIYYDLHDYEGLESLLHAFANSLRRNKRISDYQLRVHQNLIRYVKRVNQLRYRKALIGRQAFARQLQNLEERIRQKREITNISWLLDKLSELQ